MYQKEQAILANPYLLCDPDADQTQPGHCMDLIDHKDVIDSDNHVESNESAQLRRLNNLFQALPGAVVMLDGQGRVVQSNPSAKDLLGEPLDDEFWRDVVDRAFSPRWDDGHDISLVNGRIVNLSTQPMIDEPGQILLIKDVTETRQLQEQLYRAKRLSAKGEMAAALAHQIRTPLSSAILYLSNLSNDKLDNPSRQKFTDKALARLNYLERLIEDMLLFARGGQFEMQSVHVRDFLHRLIQQVEIPVQESEMNLRVDPNTEDAVIRISQEAMLSIFGNLVDNAIHACGAGGTILITAKRTAINNREMIQISVADNGPGIPEAIRTTLFEPFVTTRANGTGLGLAVAQAVIRSHGGGISVRDSEAGGTIFDITLPIE